MPDLSLLRRRPAYRRLFVGETVSQLGDWMSWVALSLLALDRGGGEGALALALVLVAHSLPSAVLAPVAGRVVDGVDRRTVIVVTDLSQAVLTAGMAAAAWRGSLWGVQGLLVMRSALGAFAYAARTGALPQVVERDELLAANALSSAAWSATFAVGMALGGVLTTLGPTVALVADALTFLLSAGILAGLPGLQVARRAGDTGRLGDALAEVRGDAQLALALSAKAPLAVATGAGLVLLGLETAEWGAAAIGLGLLQALKGLATGVGPLLAARQASRGVSPGRLMGAAYAVALGGMVVLGSWPGAVGASVAVVLWGLGSGANWVVSQAELQRLAPASTLGRLAAVDALAVAVGMSGGALGAGAMVEWAGSPALALVPVAAVGSFVVLATARWHHSHGSAPTRFRRGAV